MESEKEIFDYLLESSIGFNEFRIKILETAIFT